MTIEEYVEKTKKELDLMEEEFVKNNASHPEMWPLEMEEGEWGDQELAFRFSLT